MLAGQGGGRGELEVVSNGVLVSGLRHHRSFRMLGGCGVCEWGCL